MRIDLGRLTEEETVALVKDAINQLSEQVLYDTIIDALTQMQRDELVAAIESRKE